VSSQPDRPLHDGQPETAAVSARVERLYTEHAGLVISICRAFLRDPVEAEDATQQTFLSAQRALLNGSEPREPVAWLAAIARNECLGRVRARMRDPLPTEDGELPGAAPDAHAAASRREDVERLRAALAGLPAQQREAILLRELRGLSYDEVAASLAVSTSAVESLIFRARRRLQLRLRETAASLSPGQWLEPLRDLFARLAGSGLAAPVAAKVVAVGVGTTVVAGSVAVKPQLLGLGHVPAAASAAPSRHVVRHRTAVKHVVVALPAAPAPKPQPVVAVRHVTRHRSIGGEAEHSATTSESDGPGAATTTSQEVSHEDHATPAVVSDHHESDHPSVSQAPSGGDGSHEDHPPAATTQTETTAQHEGDDGGGGSSGDG
jgi:RNA polymerase sigma-70 factor (ECF subfamily)